MRHFYEHHNFPNPWKLGELEFSQSPFTGGIVHGSTPTDKMVENLVLAVYSVNFYFPSAVCVYLQYTWYTRQVKSANWKRISTYSYRDTLM